MTDNLPCHQASFCSLLFCGQSLTITKPLPPVVKIPPYSNPSTSVPLFVIPTRFHFGYPKQYPPRPRQSRLEVTYRNSEGPFKATGFPNQEFPIPSPADAKISAETAPEIEIRKREVIHVPALPTRELFNLGSIGNQPLIYLSGVASGSPLRLWCPECPSNSGNTVGFWKTVNVNQNLNGFHHSLASGPSSALLLSSHSTTLSLTTIQENFALVRQSLGLDYNGSLNGIASGPDAFIAVGTATAPGSPITGGLIARKAFGEPWEDIFIPEVREFLHIYHLNLGWVAPAKGGSIWTSTDGSEWAQTGTAPFDLAKLVESEGRWLGATTNGEIYSWSTLLSPKDSSQQSHTSLLWSAMSSGFLRLPPTEAPISLRSLPRPPFFQENPLRSQSSPRAKISPINGIRESQETFPPRLNPHPTATFKAPPTKSESSRTGSRSSTWPARSITGPSP
jgi:hypothetical protein